jgi:hypothetical protein
MRGERGMETSQSQKAARAQDLRRKAALARRAAGVPTSGSGNVDRLLLEFAGQLEREAAALEQE